MDTDYIGQIANARWNSQTSGWLMRTPAWMEGSFKSGPRVSQRQFSAPHVGIRQNWGRSDIAEGGIKFNSRTQNRNPGGFGRAIGDVGNTYMSGKSAAAASVPPPPPASPLPPPIP
jgi:hypothetical protein